MAAYLTAKDSVTVVVEIPFAQATRTSAFPGIRRHLAAVGIPVSYTNVFWGGRSEIKPSEISPKIYHEWHAKQAI